MATPTDHPLDLVVFGATSFVGQILCRHLVSRHGIDGPIRWGIAGRNVTKLDQVAADTGADVPRIVADAADADAVQSMAAASRVVVSTVGPYALHGSELVAAAAAAGTDYCDLSGEPQWMHRMITEHHDRAANSGARLVHSCGFDSIPSDLGVWFTQQQALERYGAPCKEIAMRVKAAKGTASGGTLASALNAVAEASGDGELRRVMGDPFALIPPDMAKGPRQPDTRLPTHDDVSGSWVAPFPMASVNTKVVHRTHALLGRPWGEHFRYDEAMMMGTGPLGAVKAAAVVGGLGGFLVVAALAPARQLLGRVLPQPGEGPSPEAQEAGFFDIRFFGTTAAGESLVTKVTGDRDPGYGSTARMLGEAAVALVDLDRDRVGGGFWTPATAFGDDLIDRLGVHAGLSFAVVS